MSTVIEAHDVTKVFQEGSQRVEVLRGVSLEVRAGEVVALEGPSGSGKTTLLSIVGCILTPTSGRVEVDGQLVDGDPGRLRDVRRRSIGFVFQQFNLFPALTALENVEYALSVKRGGRGARDEAARVLKQVGLGDRLHFLPRDLSGGQKQRVAIARALAGAPPAILADEPTANLDTTAGRQVLRLFGDLARQEGKGLLIVTHDPKVREVSDRVVGIRDGQLVNDLENAEMAGPVGRERREAVVL
jgi:putative ABC transport system ATP-binding protein